MATAVAKRTKKAKNSPEAAMQEMGLPSADAETAVDRPKVHEPIDMAEIPVAAIVPCQFQPRQEFPAEEISTLAGSIRQHGLLVPIVVRRSTRLHPKYELIFGERRWRAVKQLGLPTIRAEILDCADVEIRRMVLVEVLQREGLNAIEEAMAFRSAIAAGVAEGPSELARQLGLSQGHVSNRLRLLELPDNWQRKIISHEIPPSHARSLLRYKDSPAALAAIEKDIADTVKKGGEIGSTVDFEDNVTTVVRMATSPMSGTEWSQQLHRDVTVFKPTAEQREALGIIAVPTYKGKVEERATNTKLWEMLQAEYRKQQTAKADAKAAKSERKDPEAASKKPLTAAEKKQLAEEEARRDKERARKLAEGTWEVAIDWRRYLIARACRQRQVSAEEALRLALYFATECRTCERSGAIRARGETLGDVLSKAGIVVRKASSLYGKSLAVYDALANVPDETLAETALDCFADLIWHEKEGPVAHLPDEDVLQMIEQLAIDIPDAWQAEAAGPLTERWLDLHNKDSLIDMAQTLGVVINGTKADAVEALLARKTKLPLPAGLAKPKKPKG